MGIKSNPSSLWPCLCLLNNSSLTPKSNNYLVGEVKLLEEQVICLDFAMGRNLKK